MEPQTELGVEIEAPVVEEVVAVRQYAPQAGMDVEKLMALAIEKDGAIEVIERLAKLRGDEIKRQAEEALGRAIASFKLACPVIARTKRGTAFANRDGTTSHTYYAPLDGIQAVVDPILHPLGLTYSWDNTADSEQVTTTCVLRHVLGAERRSAMSLPVTGPPKSSKTQAASGTRTFNKRITLSDVLGIATCDDVDGQDGDADEPINAAQLSAIQALVQSKQVDIDKFLAYVGVGSLKDIPAAAYGMAVRTIEAKKDKEVSS